MTRQSAKAKGLWHRVWEGGPAGLWVRVRVTLSPDPTARRFFSNMADPTRQGPQVYTGPPCAQRWPAPLLCVMLSGHSLFGPRNISSTAAPGLPKPCSSHATPKALGATVEESQCELAARGVAQVSQESFNQARYLNDFCVNDTVFENRGRGAKIKGWGQRVCSPWKLHRDTISPLIQGRQ